MSEVQRVRLSEEGSPCRVLVAHFGYGVKLSNGCLDVWPCAMETWTSLPLGSSFCSIRGEDPPGSTMTTHTNDILVSKCCTASGSVVDGGLSGKSFKPL